MSLEDDYIELKPVKVFLVTENHIKETVENAAELIANGNKDEALEKLLKFMWETLRDNNE